MIKKDTGMDAFINYQWCLASKRFTEIAGIALLITIILACVIPMWILKFFVIVTYFIFLIKYSNKVTSEQLATANLSLDQDVFFYYGDELIEGTVIGISPEGENSNVLISFKYNGINSKTAVHVSLVFGSKEEAEAKLSDSD